MSLFVGKTVMGNPIVLKALYEELMLMGVYCPYQVGSLDRIWEKITVLMC